jgi:hypothetical protein
VRWPILPEESAPPWSSPPRGDGGSAELGKRRQARLAICPDPVWRSGSYAAHRAARFTLRRRGRGGPARIPADLGGYGFRHAWSGARADRVDLCAATKLIELAGRALTPAPNQPSGSPARSVHPRRKPARLVLHGFLRGASGQVCKPDPGAQSSRWLGRVRVRLGSGAGLRLGSLRRVRRRGRCLAAARPAP